MNFSNWIISFTKDEYANLPRDICNFSKSFKARYKLFLRPLLLSATFSPMGDFSYIPSKALGWWKNLQYHEPSLRIKRLRPSLEIRNLPQYSCSLFSSSPKPLPLQRSKKKKLLWDLLQWVGLALWYGEQFPLKFKGTKILKRLLWGDRTVHR